MALHRKNALPELMDLRARIDHASGSKDEAGLSVELRIGSADLEDDQGELLARVSVKKAILSVDCDGMDIAPGERHGEPVKEGGPVTKHQIRSEAISTVQGGLDANLVASSKEGASGAGALKAGASREIKTSRTRESSYEEQVSFVRALGGDRWEISEPDETPLEGTYLNDKRICSVVPSKGANRQVVKVTTEVKQRDLDFDHSHKFFRGLTATHSRLAKIVIAKAINGGGSEYRGKVILSEVEVENMVSEIAGDEE